jgi:hypothetical protein
MVGGAKCHDTTGTWPCRAAKGCGATRELECAYVSRFGRWLQQSYGCMGATGDLTLTLTLTLALTLALTLTLTLTRKPENPKALTVTLPLPLPLPLSLTLTLTLAGHGSANAPAIAYYNRAQGGTTSIS